MLGTLTDLTKYSPRIADGGVVGWPTEHTVPEREKGHRKISFTLKSQVLSSEINVPDEEVQGRVQSEAKDEL